MNEPPSPSSQSDILIASAAPVRPRVSRSFAFLLAVSALLASYVIWPFAAPLFLGAVVAVTVAPFNAWLHRRLGGRAHVVAAVSTLLLFIVIVAPMASLIAMAASEVTSGLAWIRDTVGVHSFADLPSFKLPEHIEAKIDQITHALHLSRQDLQTYASRALEYAQPLTQKLLEVSLNVAMQSLVMLLAFYIFVVEGHRLVDLLLDVSPLQPAQTDELLQEFRNVSSASILGSVLTAVLQGLTVLVGFIVAGVPHAAFFAIVTVLTSFVPVIGSTLVWGPAAIILALTSHLGAAIALAIWCFVTVFIIDHVVKPIVLRGKVAMHGGIVLLSLLGGLEVFGLIGLIAGPLCVAFFLALLRMFRRDFAH